MTRVETIGDVQIFGDEPRIVVYAIYQRGAEVPVYIGSTQQSLKVRTRGHIFDARAGSPLPVHEWMRERAFAFDVRALEYVTEEQRHARERFWVDGYRGSVLNVTDGGPGMSGHKFAGTHHAQRIGFGLRAGAHFPCLRCGKQFWRKPRDIKKGHNKYCSRVCSNARHKEFRHAA